MQTLDFIDPQLINVRCIISALQQFVAQPLTSENITRVASRLRCHLTALGIAEPSRQIAMLYWLSEVSR